MMAVSFKPGLMNKVGQQELMKWGYGVYVLCQKQNIKSLFTGLTKGTQVEGVFDDLPSASQTGRFSVRDTAPVKLNLQQKK